LEPFAAMAAANDEYVRTGAHRRLGVKPSSQLALVTCMDARIDAFAALGLDLGDAHVIRVAGARVNDEVLRSLTLSTHVLDTRAVAVVGHTRCGLRDVDGVLLTQLRELLGHDPMQREWGTFQDVESAVAEDVASLLAWPDRPAGMVVAGYVLDVDDGKLHEIAAPQVATDPDA
jgi:carbonic anhydrase